MILSIALLLAASTDWRTPTELSEYRETPRYAETRAWFERLERASSSLKVLEMGRSSEGRALYAAVLSGGQEFSAQAARASGKPVLLIQACIHAGENEGKDALMALARDLLIAKQVPEVLEQVIVVMVPIYNVDGHERFSPHNRINQNGPAAMGWRSTAQNLNLNRDFFKAEAPETRAWLKLWNTWQPDLLVDLHNTNGADYPYQLSYSFESHAGIDPALVSWQQQFFAEQAVTATTKRGWLMAPYLELRVADQPKMGFKKISETPRYSTGYGNLRNRPALLLETHMLKDLRVRTQVNQAYLGELLSAIAAKPDALKAAVKTAERNAATRAPGTEYVLSWKTTDATEPLAFKGYAYTRKLSEISGTFWTQYDTSKIENWSVPYQSTQVPDLKVSLPAGYLIPGHWQAARKLLALHGVKSQVLGRELELRADTYRFAKVTYATQPFEGRVRVTELETRATQEPLKFAANSIWIDLQQPAANAAIQLLEPLAPDSLVRMGYGDAFMSRTEYAEGRVLEAKARELLAADPKLVQEFEAKLADPLFAGSAAARLDFFYQRLPHYDANYLRYPVARLSTAQLEELRAAL